jgi:hypothetical protein
LTNEVGGVLDNYDCKLDELVHYKSNNGVVMVEVRVAELDVDGVYDWLKETCVHQLKVSVEVKIKVLELKLNIA